MDVTRGLCPHFGDCGGCQMQDVSYAEQLARKEVSIRRALSGPEFSDTVIERPIGMAKPLRYRNKMEFTFDPSGRPGLHRRGDYLGIVPIRRCYLCSESMEEVLRRVAEWSRRWGLSGYDKHSHSGLLRHLSVRESVRGDLLVSLFTSREELTRKEHCALDSLFAELKGLTVGGLLWVVNPARSDAARTDEGRTVLLAGEDTILDSLAGFDYRIGVGTFFQINVAGAEKLIEIALQFSRATSREGASFDIFSGVGTFSLPLAQGLAPDPVVGIEIVPAAVISARENAAHNELTNAHFIESDARRGIPLAMERWGRPVRVMLDPPRSGAGGKVMRKIGRSEADVVIYVSCNPTSFAEDVRQLTEFGYVPRTVIPIDMFPQTNHVETVALITRVTE